MAAKAVKTEAIPQDQDLLSAGEPAAAAPAETTEPAAPAEEPAAEKDSDGAGEESPPAAPAADGRKELNRDEPYGEITGASNGACYVQGEIYFDAEGKELL